jgi:hypothetical protein
MGRKVQVFKLAVFAILFVKLIVLAIGSYPFDFATYVYQARSFFEYGITPLFYWNKGIPLLGLFYGQYATYQFLIQVFAKGIEHTALLHFIFKLPFFFFDILSALAIRDIVLWTSQSRYKANAAALFWLMNPFVLWIVEFQGQYGIVAVFFSLLGIALLIRKRYGLAGVCLALSASVYYYAIIFVPFFLLKSIADGRRYWLKLCGAFFGVLVLCYLPFLWGGTLLTDLFGSLLHHSAPDAGANQAILLPNFSLLKIPYYAFSGTFPTSTSNPQIFKLAQLLTFFGVFVIGVYFLRKAWVYSKSKSYAVMDLLGSLLFVTTIFLILVGKLQDHYFIWVFPLMIIFGMATRARSIIQTTFIISAVCLLLVSASHTIGVELLDILPFGTLNYYVPLDNYAQALGGFVVVAMLLLNLAAAAKRGLVTHALIPDRLIYGYTFITYLWFGYVALYSYVALTGITAPSTLGSDANVYNFAYAPTKIATTPVHDELVETPLQNGNFESVDNKSPGGLGKPWSVYSYGSQNGIRISDAPAGDIMGSHALKADVNAVGGKTQVNMGSNGSDNLILLRPLERYVVDGSVRTVNLPDEYANLSVRFADSSRSILSGSDLKLNKGLTKNGWTEYSSTFETPHEAKFAEITANFDVPPGAVQGGEIFVDNLSLDQIRGYLTETLSDEHPKSNPGSTLKYIIAGNASKFFYYDVQILRTDPSQKITALTLGKCTKPETINTSDVLIDARLPVDCLKDAQNQTLNITIANYSKPPDANLSLTHDTVLVHNSDAHPLLLKVTALIAGLLNLTAITFLVMFVWRLRQGEQK